MIIRNMAATDWPAVCAIYLEGIATGNATFETAAPEWSVWDSAHRADCRFVAEEGGIICGWAALTPVSGRCVYAGVADLSIYIGEKYRGQGIGKRLMETLIEASEQAGFWTLQAGIFPENTGSLRLHENAGFQIVGRRQRIGQMKGVWRDTLLLDRRSTTVGSD